MLFGLPSGMHPTHPISKRTGDPIPREQQLLRLGQADIRILGKRRQRQPLRRLPQRPHQHPRRPGAGTTARVGGIRVSGIRAGTTTIGTKAIGARAVRAVGTRTRAAWAPGAGRAVARVRARVSRRLEVDDRKVLAGG
ncbi:hypothetical protein ACIG5D_35185 [Microbispora rosea]|uniref:hypothetical protein n=1 Tax=Microbispora rosea TaxID=58117 RepID=UPI0037C91285